MKSPRIPLLYGMALLLLGQSTHAAVEIPKLDGIVIDGQGADWRDKGFRVEVMAGTAGAVRAPKQFDPQFRLAWDERGLLVLATVRDCDVVAAEPSEEIWMKDSVELFLGEAPGSRQFFQVVIASGEKGKAQIFVRDHRMPAGQKLELETAAVRTEEGYIVEARLPWSALGITPKIGAEAGFQIRVNDVSRGGARLSAKWFPTDDRWKSPEPMERLRLSGKASPSEKVAAGVSLDQGRPRVDIVAPASFAGTKVSAKAKGKVFATSTFEAAAGRARVTFFAPFEMLEVSCGDAGSVMADCSHFADEIGRAVDDADVVFTPCVFSGERFPSCKMAPESGSEQTLGRCELSATFYDADYHEVKTAAKPGRYGAIVEVRTEAGKTFQRFKTLYRTPERVDWRGAKIGFESVAFPPALGLNPAAVQECQSQVGSFFMEQIREMIGSQSTAAVFFAGLAERKPGSGEPVRMRNSPYSADAAWWYGLKRQTGNLRSDYYVHLPKGYAKDGAQKWPLILFLHGSGERGDEIARVRRTGLPLYLESHPDLPAIVVAPQCRAQEWWSVEELNGLLGEVQTKYAVDADRVYLTGLSMGGFGSWMLAAAHPERFAAVVPICGGGDPEDVARIKSLPIWVFHGAKDPTVPCRLSQEMVDALQKVNGNVKFTVYPEAGHNCWDETYARPELYDWLLKQKRPARE